MASNITELKAMRIGCDNVVWAALTKDDTTALTYDTPVTLPGVMTLNINPNMSIETAYYDDGPGEVATTLGNIEITFNKSTLGLKEQAYLLGAAYIKAALKPATGSDVDVFKLLSGVADTPPEGALGFRTLKSDGTYRYVWLYKGKFAIPVSNNETKGDSINFQSDEITGRFVPVRHPFKLGTNYFETADKDKIIYPWKAEWDETDDTATTTQKAKIKGEWFTQVIQPTYDPGS